MAKKPLFNKVVIVGAGLIGGSIGLAVKKRKLAKFVAGVVRRRETAIKVIEKKAVDMATLDLAEGVQGADLVILCAPVSTIIRQIPLIKPYLKKNAIVIDVGSSKRRIESAARKHLKRNTFVGCHPMAGSACLGVEHADAELFDGAQCFITRSNHRVHLLWKAMGAHPILLDAKLHDAWVARASCLPHLLAFSLFQKESFGRFSLTRLKALNPSIKELARLAHSDAALWSDIFMSNPDTIKALYAFEKSLGRLKKILHSKKSGELENYIRVSNRMAAAVSAQ